MAAKEAATQDHRVAAVAAGGFTIAFVAAAAPLGEMMGALGDGDHVFVDHYASGARRAGDIAGGSLLVVAAISLLILGTALRPVLGGGLAAAVAERATVGAALLIAMAAALFASTPLSMSFGGMFDDAGQFDGGHAAVLPQAAVVVLLLAAYPLAAVGAGATALAARALDMPRWYVWVGFGCAALMPLGFFFFPIVTLPIWSGATAIAAWRSSTSKA